MDWLVMFQGNEELILPKIRNDLKLLEETKVGRNINRHYYTSNEIEEDLNRKVVKQLLQLMKFRNEQPAFDGTFEMMKTNYIGAVSILNIIATDIDNKKLERIIGLSSLSGVRGRKSNFVYGSTKSAFTQYLAGLRQELNSRKIIVNVVVSGYINTKINAGLDLNKSLLMEPDYVAKQIVNAGNSFTIVPNFKWKIIYWVLKLSPEFLVAKLP